MTTFPAPKTGDSPGRFGRPVRAVLFLGVAVALVASASQVYYAVRAAQIEYNVLHPRRGPVALPSDAAALGLVAVHYPSTGSGEIAGWLVPSTTGASVLLVHGSEADRRQMLPAARALAAVGIGSLLIDEPGAGESAGRVTVGDSERDAVLAGLRFLRATLGTDSLRVGAYGFSAGSLAVLALAGTHVRALAVAGCPTDLATATAREYRGAGRVAQWSAAAMLSAFGVDVAKHRPLDAVTHLGDTPLLLISGERDVVVIPSDTRTLAAAAARSEWHVVPAMGHEEPATYSPAGAQLLVDFFQRTLR